MVNEFYYVAIKFGLPRPSSSCGSRLFNIIVCVHSGSPTSGIDIWYVVCVYVYSALLAEYESTS